MNFILYSKKYSFINKIIYLSTVLSSILVIISIISISLFTWQKIDDFSMLNGISKLGIFQHIINRYFSWDGRALTLGAIQALFLKYLPIEIINLIWIICLIFTALISFKIFLYLLKLENKLYKTDYIIGIAIFTAILWYGFKNHISETVYWATGGVYSFALLLATFWLYLWITFFSIKLKINILIKIFFYLFTVYVGALTENLSCSLLVFIGIEMLKFILINNYIIARRIILLGTLLIIGLLIIILSPGNFVRSEYGLHSFTLSLASMTINFIRTLLIYIRLSIPLFIILLISVPLTLTLVKYKSKQEYKNVIRIKIPTKFYIIINRKTIKRVLLYLLVQFQYFVAALASLFPFILLPDFVTPRTSIYFMAFIFFWVYFQILPYILPKILKPITNNRLSHNIHIHYLWFTAFLSCIFVIAISHIISLYWIKEKVLARETKIKAYSHKNVDVITYPIDKTGLPFSYTFEDISNDKNNWINHAVEIYYKLKSIRTNNKIDYKI